MNRKKPERKIPNPSDFKVAFCRRTYCNPKQNGGIFIAKLIVAEKPSVAMSYAKVLGATNRKDGYLEGNGYLVSWCVGHLVELAPPNVYDAKYVKWSIADLPMGIRSLSAYIRKMALDGYCLHLDLKELQRMAYLLQMCSNNLNQYAKAANENGRVYAADMEDLRQRLDELIEIGRQILSRLADL